jgi:hypothetical protein
MMGKLWDRVEERAGGGIVRSNGASVAEVVARLERGEALAGVGDALGLDAADLISALAHAGLGPDEADGPTLTQVPGGRPDLLPALRERSLAALFPGAGRAPVLALSAGLLQVHDEWGPSHEAAQEADDLGETATSAFWHGIAHRREPDPGNASYWFRRVGRSHPAFAPLAAAARPLLDEFGDPATGEDLLAGGGWNPSALIALCTRARPGTPAAALARKLQRLEMIALLEVTVAPLLGPRAA